MAGSAGLCEGGLPARRRDGHGQDHPGEKGYSYQKFKRDYETSAEFLSCLFGNRFFKISSSPKVLPSTLSTRHARSWRGCSPVAGHGSRSSWRPSPACRPGRRSSAAPLVSWRMRPTPPTTPPPRLLRRRGGWRPARPAAVTVAATAVASAVAVADHRGFGAAAAAGEEAACPACAWKCSLHSRGARRSSPRWRATPKPARAFRHPPLSLRRRCRRVRLHRWGGASGTARAAPWSSSRTACSPPWGAVGMTAKLRARPGGARVRPLRAVRAA